jgi:hypothetical protein
MSFPLWTRLIAALGAGKRPAAAESVLRRMADCGALAAPPPRRTRGHDAALRRPCDAAARSACAIRGFVALRLTRRRYRCGAQDFRQTFLRTTR